MLFARLCGVDVVFTAKFWSTEYIIVFFYRSGYCWTQPDWSSRLNSAAWFTHKMALMCRGIHWRIQKKKSKNKD